MKSKALCITDGLLTETNAKTTHGLLRGSRRFDVIGIIDYAHAGQDAGDVLDFVPGGTPIHATLGDALEKLDQKLDCVIIGVATKGGVLSESIKTIALEAASQGLDVVNGLHATLDSDPEIVAAAAASGATLHDIRKPKPFEELHFWHGDIQEVECPIIAVLGLDCAVGKRTTARLLCETLADRGVNAEMIYTGQTGWMLGYDHGFIFDSTPNDFVSGEMEHAIVSCWREKQPDLIMLEGQSSLRNPSGPCGPEFLLSANAKAVILQCPVGRTHFIGFEDQGLTLPDVADEIELIRQFGAQTIALGLNSRDASPEEVAAYAEKHSAALGIPAIDPFQHIDALADTVQNYCASFAGKA